MYSFLKNMGLRVRCKKCKGVYNIYCFSDRQEVSKCLCPKCSSKQSQIENRKDGR